MCLILRIRVPDKRGKFKDNFSYFSTKTYVVTTHLNHLAETVLMVGHKICFYGEIRLIIPNYLCCPLLSGALIVRMFKVNLL